VSGLKISIVIGSVLMLLLLGSSNGTLGFQTNIFTSYASGSCSNPVQTFQIGHTKYFENCYYEVGVSTVDGGINYTTIAGLSPNKTMTVQTGLLAEELNVGYGGKGQFSKGATISPISSTSSYTEIEISGKIGTLLAGTENLTFFSDKPYFVASVSSTILVKDYYSSHDIANFVGSPWTKTWIAPISDGVTETCNSNGCTTYTSPGGFDTKAGDIKSNIQTNGPTWGWLGNSATSTGRGIGFMLLNLSSTQPAEAAITHYELGAGRFEVEGDGVAPADKSSGKLAPHDLGYSVKPPQTLYVSFLVYLNNAPWTTFYNFAKSIFVGAQIGSYPASSFAFGTFAEKTRSPNLSDNKWYITNLVTSASEPLASANDGLIYFTSRNGSLANDFPLKMYLSINGSTAIDKNFSNGVPNVLSDTPSNTKIEVKWSDTTDHLALVMNFSTKSNSNKINVTGTLQATSPSVTINSLAVQTQVLNNYIDGTGPPNYYPSSFSNSLSWNYTNGVTSEGVAIALPSNNGFSGAVSFSGTNNEVANLALLPFSSSAPTNFAFAVSFYSPLLNYYAGYTENINVPILNIVTSF
jgi:hypothetical protein